MKWFNSFRLQHIDFHVNTKSRRSNILWLIDDIWGDKQTIKASILICMFKMCLTHTYTSIWLVMLVRLVICVFVCACSICMRWKLRISEGHTAWQIISNSEISHSLIWYVFCLCNDFHFFTLLSLCTAPVFTFNPFPSASAWFVLWMSYCYLCVCWLWEYRICPSCHQTIIN